MSKAAQCLRITASGPGTCCETWSPSVGVLTQVRKQIFLHHSIKVVCFHPASVAKMVGLALAQRSPTSLSTHHHPTRDSGSAQCREGCLTQPCSHSPSGSGQWERGGCCGPSAKALSSSLQSLTEIPWLALLMELVPAEFGTEGEHQHKALFPRVHRPSMSSGPLAFRSLPALLLRTQKT